MRKSYYLIAVEAARIFVQYYVAKIVKQCFANSVFAISTPPWLSCVTLLTASALFDQDLIKVCWSLRTCLISPQREAV